MAGFSLLRLVTLRPPNHAPVWRSDSAVTLGGILRWRAEHQADRAALTYLADAANDETTLTYAELDRRARAVAVRLREQAVPGDRALLLYPAGIDFPVAFFACLYAGVIAVPAYPPRNPGHLPRLRALMADAGARVALTNAKTLTALQRQFADEPAWLDLSLLATDEVDPRRAADWRDPGLKSADLAFLQYTSGSTGAPKGVMVTQDNIVYNAHYIHHAFALHADSVSVSWLPAFHDMGLIDGLLTPIYGGFPGVIMSPVSFIQRPLRWLEAITRFRGTHGGGPNFGYDLCVEKATPEALATLDLSSWESAYNGAEPVRARTLHAFSAAYAPAGFRATAHYPCFGMAETTLMVSGGDVDRAPVITPVDRVALEQGRFTPASSGAEPEATFDLVSSGRAWLDTSIAIVDTETGARAADGVIGEVWVAGPTVAAGYWQRPDATAETFQARLPGDERAWLRTGDLGYVDAAGELFICGRAKDLIIIRGRNHYPQDLELTAEQADPALKPGGAAAFSVEIDGEERLVVVQEVLRTALRSADPQQLGAAIARAVLVEHEVQPAVVVLLKTGTVPKTSSGKIQRRGARAQFLAGELAAIGEWRFTPPTAATPAADESSKVSRPELVTWLQTRLARRLGCAPTAIAVTEPFSSFGLDSASLVALSGDLRDYLGREVPPMVLYDYPDINRLADHLCPNAVAKSAVTPAPEATGDDAVAIIGMGLRFPGGANDAASFWRLLRDGVDAITPVPADRFDVDAVHADEAATPGRTNSRFGGFLAGIDLFDESFFGIAPREAAAMDPQHRLLLEVAWHALENAAIAPGSLAGSDTGVFVGLSTHDYEQRVLPADDLGRIDAYGGTGNAHSAAAGRLAYVLGLEGPAMAIDTACSSSLVAVHQAAQALRAGECRLALAGGVNVILNPELAVNFAQARMLAPDGRCKAFAAEADGYVRSEGCGLVVLKRLADAEADGDPILAVVRGSAVNQDGRSNGLTAPNGPAQEKVVRAALRRARLQPTDIGYVEAHGTGTELGDPIEVRALAASLGDGRERSQALRLGSVKSNLGHLEAAAGIAGLIKAVLALQHGELPASLHCARLNPHLEWDTLPLAVVTAHTTWPADLPRRAGVSSFGFTGTNAHVVVEAPPPVARTSAPDPAPTLLALAGRDPTQVGALVDAVAGRLATVMASELPDVVHTLNASRSVGPVRVAVSGSTSADLVAALRQATVSAGAAVAPVRVGFLFTGQGAQTARMGRELYDSEPVYRTALDRCAGILDTLLPEPLLPVLFAAPDEPRAARLHETAFTQPALFALEWSLAELWRAWGLTPSVVTGHSVGEYVAGTVAGVFSLEDGLRLIAARGRLMQALPAGGGMLAVFADEATAAAAVAGRPDTAIAAVNAATEVVLAGPLTALQEIAQAFAARNIACRPLTVSHAFHSPLMRPMLAEFERELAATTFAAPKFPVISNLGPDADLATAAHWRDHVLGAVRFADGVRALQATGVAHLLEVGPRPVLTGLVRKTWTGPVTAVASLRPGHAELASLLQSAATLFAAGAAVQPAAISAPHGRRRADLPLPGQPFSRRRHWLERPVRVTATAAVSEVAIPNNPTLRDWTAPASADRMALGVMFFNGEETVGDPAKYSLVLEAARFADAHGFSSVWVPERHYTRFGGLYPNPTVLAAALARETRQVRLMAGSLVAPLHHPLRVAEDWSVIDNLSDGRVGISFAPGWNPGDFAMVPEAYAKRRELVNNMVEQVRTLWRGEAVTVTLPDGSASEARVFPTPVQPELPLWLTAAGNPESFAYAGRIGAHLLTHLLDQEPAQLGENIARYRAARAEAGLDPAAGRVAVMLHTFCGPDDDSIRARIRRPYVDFLKANLHLLKGLAASRGQEMDPTKLSEADREDFAGMLFDRFYARRALFGTVDACAALVRQLGEVGVNEIACLLDFGAKTDDVLAALPYLDQLRARFADTPAVAPATAAPSFDRPPATRVADVLHAVTWHPAAPPVPADVSGNWIVLDEGRGLGAALADALRARGGAVTMVEPEATDFDGVLESIDGSLRGVLHSRSLAVVGQELTAETIAAGQRLGSATLVNLVQALERAGKPAPIWLLTRGAEGLAGPEATAGDPAQAAVRGLAKVVAIEHPELWGAAFDLDPVAIDLVAEAEQVVARLGSADEDQLAWRGGEVWCARLVPAELSTSAAVAVRADATYLITGGLGAMGRAVLRWLVARGARRLVVTGRQTREQLDDAKQTLLAELGDAVRYVAVDAADADGMRRLVAEIGAGAHPLAGVLHLAGVAQDRPVRELEFARDAAVHDAKLRGAWILHELTRELPLDWFATFSSITVVWGTMGLPLYAAASQFLDALGDYRRAQGLPATVVNFGPWSDGGMVAGDNREQLARVGVFTMTPETGVAVLEQALAGQHTRQVAVSIDRQVLRDLFAVRGRQSLFSPPPEASAGDPTETASFKSSAPTALWVELVALGADERIARLSTWLQTAVAATLRLGADQLPGATRGFFEMGMDSLMAIEIKNRLQTELGVPLRATVVFNYPNIGALAAYLASLLPATPATGAGDDEELGTLSTDELTALLEDELAALEKNEGNHA